MSGLVRRVALVFVASCLLGGCEVGPDFVRPGPPAVAGYTPTNTATNALAAGNGEPAQRLVSGQAVPVAWWHLFHSRALDRLVRQVIADNLTVEAADNTLTQAQEAVLQARGALLPQLDLAASAERQSGPSFQLGVNPARHLPTYNIYEVGPLASFSPDVFGTTRRKVEQQASLAQYQAYQLAAAQLTVTGDVVTEALTIASDRAQIAAINDIIADDEKNLALVRQKFTAGRAPRTDVLLAESELTNDRALLPPLQQLLAAAEDGLTTLASKFPAGWSPPAFAFRDFKLPADLPVSVPSALVHQRPDILAAEAQLHAASAAVGVAVGQTYPLVNLSASLEPASTNPALLFNTTALGSGLVWTALGSVSAPIFHGGALEAQKQEAIDAFRASSATYRQVVVSAFGQVADALRALQHDAQLVAAEHQALDIANQSVALQREGYDAGKVNLLNLIDAQRSAQQARIGYARAVGQRLLDTAQLFVALGGGWSEDRALCGDCAAP